MAYQVGNQTPGYGYAPGAAPAPAPVAVSDTRDMSGTYRLAGIGGTAAAVFLIAGVFTGFTPEDGLRGGPLVAAFAAWFAANAVGGIIAQFAFAAFLVFMVGLFGILRRAEGGHAPLAHLALGGGIATAAFAVAWFAVSIAVSAAAVRGADASAILALTTLDAVLSLAFSVPLAVALIPAGVAIFRTRVVPRWLGGLAIAAPVLTVAALAALFQMGSPGDDSDSSLGILALFGFILFVVWLVAMGVVLLLRARMTARPAAPPAPSYTRQ